MKSVGVYMVFFGLVSMVLQIIGMEFVLLSWINTWGKGSGWLIRIAFVIVGGAIVMYALRDEEE